MTTSVPNRAVRALLHLLLAASSAVTLYPILWMISGSLRP